MSNLRTIDRATGVIRVALLLAGALSAATLTLLAATDLGPRALIVEAFVFDVAWLTAAGISIYFARTREGGRTMLESWQLVARRVIPGSVRHFFLLELTGLRALAGTILRRQPIVPAAATPVHPRRGVDAFLIAMIVVVAIEAAVVELVVPWLQLRLIIHVFEAYAIIFVLGQMFVPRQFPHYVTRDELVLRSGTREIARIPLRNISAAVKQLDTSVTSNEVRGGVLRLPMRGECTHALRLRTPHEVTLPGWTCAVRAQVTEIRLATESDLTGLTG